jgi:hypothetical protein
VFVVRCVGSGLCDRLITRYGESYSVCVSVCVRNLDTSQQGSLHLRWSAAPLKKVSPRTKKGMWRAAEIQLHLLLTSALDRRKCDIFMAWPYYAPVQFNKVSRDSSVGIASRYGQDGPGNESRWEARFSAPVQTGPGAHPASYIMGTGSFPRVKRPGRGAGHPPLLAHRLRKE